MSSDVRSRFARDPLAAGRELKSALARGELRVGVFQKMPSPDVVELVALAGLDFVVADAEHGPSGPETCQQMARAADAAGIPMLVRIGESNSAATINRYLETGACGVVLPRMSSPEAAASVHAALLHPPVGTRGLAGSRWARYGAHEPLHALVRALPEALVVCDQIEDVEAIDNLAELLAVAPPADVYFIGPTDLSASMGLAGDSTAPQVVAAVERAIEQIAAAGRTPGILASSIGDALQSIRLGARFIAFNAEGLLVSGARGVLDGLREVRT